MAGNSAKCICLPKTMVQVQSPAVTGWIFCCQFGCGVSPASQNVYQTFLRIVWELFNKVWHWGRERIIHMIMSWPRICKGLPLYTSWPEATFFILLLPGFVVVFFFLKKKSAGTDNSEKDKHTESFVTVSLFSIAMYLHIL